MLQLLIHMSELLDFDALGPDPANIYVCHAIPVSSPIDLTENAHGSKVYV